MHNVFTSKLKSLKVESSFSAQKTFLGISFYHTQIPGDHGVWSIPEKYICLASQICSILLRLQFCGKLKSLQVLTSSHYDCLSFNPDDSLDNFSDESGLEYADYVQALQVKTCCSQLPSMKLFCSGLEGRREVYSPKCCRQSTQSWKGFRSTSSVQ